MSRQSKKDAAAVVVVLIFGLLYAAVSAALAGNCVFCAY